MSEPIRIAELAQLRAHFGPVNTASLRRPSTDDYPAMMRNPDYMQIPYVWVLALIDVAEAANKLVTQLDAYEIAGWEANELRAALARLDFTAEAEA